MGRVVKCSVEPAEAVTSSGGAPTSRCHRRKRRFPIPRQALGLDLDLLFPYGVPIIEPATAKPSSTLDATDACATTEPAEETDKKPRLVRSVLWTCIIILLLILFRDWFVRFFHESPFAWPSINGDL